MASLSGGLTTTALTLLSVTPRRAWEARVSQTTKHPLQINPRPRSRQPATIRKLVASSLRKLPRETRDRTKTVKAESSDEGAAREVVHYRADDRVHGDSL